jgi:hypothetical protein
MEKKAWVVAVSMGYGHQRTAYPLKNLAFDGKVINANDYPGIPEKDRKMWERAKAGYEFISRLRRFPIIGKIIFGMFDRLQRILSFYPKRDLSEPNLQLKQTLAPIKKGWGEHLIKKLSEKPLPLVGTFFTIIFMAEHFKYPGDIYCVICDADISRTWAPLNPQKSKIKYFAPNERVVERLKAYGIKEKNIFLTGYPLPLENIGSENLEIVRHDLSHRILNLDPQRRYLKYYDPLVKHYVGSLPQKSNHPLTIMFAVGGAGAQKEIGIKIVKSLAVKIWAGEIKMILVAGIREGVKEYFEKNLERLGFKGHKNVEIIFEKDIKDYFQKFNQALRTTDILWTKPSELSFYSALGLPIIIAPPIGSQEHFNKRWLLKSGFGNLQENPRYTYQWLLDWVKRGYLAEAAMQGFIEGRKLGTLEIKKICFS